MKHQILPHPLASRVSFGVAGVVILLPVSLALAAFDDLDPVVALRSVGAFEFHSSSNHEVVDAVKLHQLPLADRLDELRVPRDVVQRQAMTQAQHVHQRLLRAKMNRI